MLASQKIQFHIVQNTVRFQRKLKRICSRTLSLQQVFLEPFHRPTHPTFKFCHRRLSNLLILLLCHGKMKMISPRFATDDRRAVLGQWPWKKGMQYDIYIYIYIYYIHILYTYIYTYTYNYEYYMNHMLWCCHNSCEFWLANQSKNNIKEIWS